MIPVSGTAVGLSLIIWSLRRARKQHRRRDVVEVLQEQRVMAPEGPPQATEQQPAVTITEPVAEVGETDLGAQNTSGGQSRSSTTVSPKPSSENAGGPPLPEQRRPPVRDPMTPFSAKTEYECSDPSRPPEGCCTRELAPAPRQIEEVEDLLFAIEARMYELKAEAEELPAVQTRRRARRGPVDEQLLLWPDADDPPAGPDQPADIAAT